MTADVSPLLRRHLGEIRLDLRLRHRGSGLYLGRDGLVADRTQALVRRVGAEGATARELHIFFAADLGANWVLQCYAAGHFEIDSDLARP